MAYRAGTAFVAVTPSFKGFQTKVAAETKKLRPISVPIKYETPKTAPIIPSPKPVRVPVALDQGSFERNVKGKLRAALASLPKEIGLQADASEAEREIASLRTQLENLSKAKIGVDLSVDAALAEIDYVRRELTRLGAESPNIQVSTDAADAAAKLGVVEEKAKRLDRQRPTIRVDADTSRANAKLDALKRKANSLGGGRHGGLISLGVAAAPAIAGAGIVGAGALGGLGALAAGAGAGALGVTAIGLASMAQAVKIQKQIAAATKTRATAVAGVRSAERSLASAVASADEAQIQAARAVADAERGLADARRNGSRAIVAAEQSLADARRAAARVNESNARSIQAAQDRLASANQTVTDSERSLHVARVQAKRDLDDLRAKVRANALEVRAAEMAAKDSQANLANVEANIFSTSDDIARARLAAAEAEQKLAKSRRQSKRDATDLASAEKNGVNGNAGVRAAREQVAQARKDQGRARQELTQARKDAAEARADAARNVGRAETNLAQTRSDAARSVADAERNLSRARVDGAHSVADANRRLANAHKAVAAAQDKVTKAETKRKTLLDSLTPSQKKVLAGIIALKAAWHLFLQSVDAPLGAASSSAMNAMVAALPALTRFVRPAARGLADMFDTLGKAAGTRGFRQFAGDFGKFAGSILRDAGPIIVNVATGLGNLFRAFFPLGLDMSKGIVGLTKRFADWSKDIGKSKGFKDFIGYVRQVGPMFLHVLGAAAGALVNIAKALAPAAVPILKGLTWGFQQIAAIPPRTLALVAAGIELVVGALMLSTGNPMGLLLVVSGLATGFTGLSGQSKQLDGRMKGLRDTVKDLFNWLGRKWDNVWKTTLRPGLKDITKVIRKDFLPAWDAFWPAIQPIVHFLGEVLFREAKSGLGRVLTYVRGFFKILSGVMNIWTGTLTGDWRRWGKGMSQVTSGIFTILRGLFRVTFLGRMGDIVGAAVKNIGNRWKGIQSAFAGPVNWIIKNVLNKLIGAVNFVSRKLGQGNILQPFGTVGGGGGGSKGGSTKRGTSNADIRKSFASGGYTGPGSKYQPAGVVHADEHVWTKEESNRFPGGHKGLARLRQQVRAGKVRVEGYSDGGRVVMDGNAVSPIAARQIRLMERISGANFTVMQGGYGGNHVAASGSSHNYPGVVDLSPASIRFETLARKVGFAAWARNIAGRSTIGKGAHIHAVSLLDPGDARSPQVTGSWRNHGTGLGGVNNDPAPHVPWLPNLRKLLGNIPLANLNSGGSGGGLLANLFNPVAALKHRLAGLGSGAPGGAIGKSLAKGAASKLLGLATGWAGRMLGSVGGAAGKVFAPNGGASGVARYAPVASSVLRMLGAPQSVLPDVMHRMMKESAGRPGIVNKWDDNWKAGHPSVGLMQVIKGTFDKYAGPYRHQGPFSYGVSTNPTANIYAGLNYAKHRYGSVAAGMNRPKGYDSGGYIPPGISTVYNGTGRPEPVFTSGQFQDLHAAATGGGKASVIKMYDVNGDLMGTMRGIAGDAVTGQSAFAGTRSRAGMGGAGVRG